MVNGKVLIRGACVLTMDYKLGTIRDGDVLFEADRIVAVGRTLAATGAELIDGTDCIVMPGFVDTHRHMWGAMDVPRLVRDAKEAVAGLSRRIGKDVV